VSDISVDEIVPRIEQNIGNAASVSYEEIGAVLSQADTALDLVRSSSYGQNLTNIAYIYNTTETGAFGVFDPNIDKSVKVKLVEEKMKSLGYQTDYSDGQLYAWTPGQDPSEVKEQMESLYSELDIKGGFVIGINAEKIMDVSRHNLEDLRAQSGNTDGFAEIDDSDLDQMIAIHLGSTIVHETVHALGDKGEAGPIAAQNAWIAEVMPKINSERQAAGRVPLEMSGETYTASSNGHIKAAQTAGGFTQYVLPEILLNMTRGEEPFMVNKDPNDSMETILSKNHHQPVPRGFITEIELEKDRMDVESSKMIIEDLLDENRPHPIIAPIKKQAGINSNVGGPHISSAFSVDDMLPRVMDGRDIQDHHNPSADGKEDYWNYRYNPENMKWKRDRFGRVTHQYDERLRIVDYDNNSPQSWDMLYREDIVTGPWRRMGSSESSQESLNSALRTIGYYKNMIKTGRRRAARFLCDSDVTDKVVSMLADSRFLIFTHGEHDALWLWGGDTTKEEIIAIESAIVEGRDSEMVNEFMGTAEDIKDRINTIVTKAAEICREHGIKGVYIVGGFPRTLVGDGDFLDVNDLDFTSGRPDECLKLGGLLASEFNSKASIYHRTMTMSFEVLGIKMDFRGNFVSHDVRNLMRAANIPVTPLNYDVYARDFTVNSLLYDFVENKIYDVTSVGVRDVGRNVIRTHFSPEEVIPKNPLVITRAIIMNMRGYTIDDSLYHSMKKLSSTIFSSDISDVRLAYEYDKIMSYEDGAYMLKEFGLDKMKEVSERAKKNNPELFD
jgi:hypothetical protein